ncbi:DUF2304 domain-containing protein [Oceanirhabdus sp. W0125-5]|uniref:DUF2304 domain-containing protein n=1 Tax=Oceanirhabdus sp. W0125-5 TaxID=2999116 RepID=UPI0022F302B2|nr:DUF2304 domain-containing protein [Oceanirhabdus sp. W0125-5]WBW98604.1 DUF2304 domain-containing protein [Oceanirhabdus sp. W0125-5]
MSILVNIGTVVAGLIVILYVIKLMVNKKMTESQSVLWLIIGVVFIVIGCFPSLIATAADILGIWYAPSIVFLIAFIGLLFIVFKNSVLLSIQSNQISELFMQIALLNMENEKLKEELKLKGKEGDYH